MFGANTVMPAADERLVLRVNAGPLLGLRSAVQAEHGRPGPGGAGRRYSQPESGSPSWASKRSRLRPHQRRVRGVRPVAVTGRQRQAARYPAATAAWPVRALDAEQRPARPSRLSTQA